MSLVEEPTQLVAETIFPAFHVMGVLGKGAGSVIYKVMERKTKRIYALKRVIRNTQQDWRFVEQAENEFEVTQNLNHPVLRRTYSFTRIRKFFRVREIHMVMEYCHGRELGKIASSLSPEDLVRIFLQLANGLMAMHREGYLHTDMKPNNVVVNDGLKTKIIDFGQSCRIGTAKQRIQGTPDFIAPEQVQRERLDTRTDVFNLGASLFWCLIGEAIPTDIPQKADRDRISLVDERMIRPPSELNPSIPEPISRLVCDCCRRQPQKRPRMSDVIRRLEIFVHALDIQENAKQESNQRGDENG
jgi:serine/threonine-protein kinase